jgi:hypothetical protein
LNPNELCWVRDDEAYAPIRFEVILITLNFEQNLIPWIKFKEEVGNKLILGVRICGQGFHFKLINGVEE